MKRMALAAILMTALSGCYGVGTLNGGAGNDSFNLRSLAPVLVNAIDGPVAINGDDDQDTLNVYDTDDATAALDGLVRIDTGQPNRGPEAEEHTGDD